MIYHQDFIVQNVVLPLLVVLVLLLLVLLSALLLYTCVCSRGRQGRGLRRPPRARRAVTTGREDRARDASGRPRSDRPRDALGRPLPPEDPAGLAVPREPEDVVRTPAESIARARDLANRRPVSLDTIRRMASYFARHLVDKQGATWADKGKGWQAWNGWGGDPGRTWAHSILRRYVD